MALNYRKRLFNEASGSQAMVQSGHWSGLGKVAVEEELSYDRLTVHRSLRLWQGTANLLELLTYLFEQLAFHSY